MRLSLLLFENIPILESTGIFASFKKYEANIQNRSDICRIIHEFQPDYIFHLAAYGTNPSNRNDLLAYETNIVGTMNILFAAKGTKCKKLFVLAVVLNMEIKRKRFMKICY